MLALGGAVDPATDSYASPTHTGKANLEIPIFALEPNHQHADPNALENRQLVVG